MDHPCHKCDHVVEDGKAFCSQCGAPQIRVAIAEPALEPVSAGDGSFRVPDSETESILPVSASNPMPAGWSRDVKACLLAAAVAVVLSFLGLNPFVAALGTGSLAVAFSRRQGALIRPAVGARIGAFSGLLLFGISTIFEVLAVVLLHKGAEIRGEMMDKLQQVAVRYPGPQVEPFLDFVKSPAGFAFMLGASLIFGLVAFVTLGSLGGALSAALLGWRDRP